MKTVTYIVIYHRRLIAIYGFYGYKKQRDSVMCYVSPPGQQGSCAPSLSASHLPPRDLDWSEEEDDVVLHDDGRSLTCVWDTPRGLELGR